ncbi:MAG: CHAP domain-containing protein [Coriobacteriaceae bacterium]|nr:CHAP domain-containing protein [Coriobacteriaceae bacterium]
MASEYDLLSRAAGEIGYSRWTDPNTGTKYGNWYAELTGVPAFGANGVPYCAMFVSYILAQVGVVAAGYPTASVSAGIRGARAAGALLSNKRDARPGDLVNFDWDAANGNGADHVGIVERNCGGYLQTIEGNTSSGSSGSQGNGGGVYRRTRSWSVVHSVIRPQYGAATRAKPVEGGKLAVDGWFGPNTILRGQIVSGAPYRDGLVSRQNRFHRASLKACTGGWQWVDGGELPGSQYIARLQSMVGAHPDGFMGPGTADAMIRYFAGASGATVTDHRLDGPSITVKAYQSWLNGQR